MKFLLFLSLFGLLFLTGCGEQPRIGVFDKDGKEVGSVAMEGDDAAVVQRGEKVVGRIESGAIIGAEGKRVGTVMEKSEHVLIADIVGNPVGSLEAETDCFGKTSAMLGRIGGKTPSSVAAGACYLLLLTR